MALVRTARLFFFGYLAGPDDLGPSAVMLSNATFGLAFATEMAYHRQMLLMADGEF